MANKKLTVLYECLFCFFGPQYWWPADSPLEVIIGAILTQNTNWKNVEKAINNLKKNKLMSPAKLYCLPLKRLATLIKPAGYFNIKSRRVKSFLGALFKLYNGDLNKMFSVSTLTLRRVLLGINGIGPETADSILLYAADRPVFVVDAYTKRIFLRHRLIKENDSYGQIQDLFMKNLRRNTGFFNEYHALLVRLGKEICTSKNPQCGICPLSKE